MRPWRQKGLIALANRFDAGREGLPLQGLTRWFMWGEAYGRCRRVGMIAASRNNCVSNRAACFKELCGIEYPPPQTISDINKNTLLLLIIVYLILLARSVRQQAIPGGLRAFRIGWPHSCWRGGDETRKSVETVNIVTLYYQVWGDKNSIAELRR
jgi:hypothetical protein